MISRIRSATQKSVATLCILLFPLAVSFGQQPQEPNAQQPAPLLSPEQLDNLVAPVALYPDPVLSTVLAASTYPLEIVEAQQWLQQNSNLKGAPLMDAAKQQNWDPSVQALVAFPEAFRLLSNDIRWTTDLGNAFLSQQADVMSAVQRMRARARANGKLATTPQQVVTTDIQDGQSAIEIQPADPQVVYVPVYQPAYVWGPPAWGAYPDLWYPAGFGYGFGFGSGIFVGGLFPGWGGWGGWGWGCGWFGRPLFVNVGFFHRYGFHGGFGDRGFGGGFGGRGVWAHQPIHRMGVPYPNRTVAGRFNSGRFNGSGMNRSQFSGGNGAQFNSGSRAQFNSGNRAQFNGGNRAQFNGGNRAQFNGSRSNFGANGPRPASPGGWQSFNGNNRQASPNYGGRAGFQASRAPAQGSRSYGGAYGGASSYRSAPSNNRAYAPPSSAPRYSAPRAQSFSAPHSFSAPRSYSAPHVSGGGAHFSGGGHSGFSGGSQASGGGGRRR
jgi:hypothetical protein